MTDYLEVFHIYETVNTLEVYKQYVLIRSKPEVGKQTISPESGNVLHCYVTLLPSWGLPRSLYKRHKISKCMKTKGVVRFGLKGPPIIVPWLGPPEISYNLW